MKDNHDDSHANRLEHYRTRTDKAASAEALLYDNILTNNVDPATKASLIAKKPITPT